MFSQWHQYFCCILGVDTDKSAAVADSSGTPVTSPDSKVEVLDGDLIENESTVTDNDKVSCDVQSSSMFGLS